MPRTDQAPAGGRQAEVLAAAARLFAQRGYHGTNMTEIGRELRLGAPSLYNHIASKKDLLAAICSAAMRRAMLLQQAALRENGHVARLRAATAAHVRFVATSRDEALVVDREFVHLDTEPRADILRQRHEYESAFRSLIEAGIAAGDFDVLDPKMASFAIIEMASSVAEWFRDTGEWSLNAVAQEYGRYALRLVGYR